MSAIIRKMVGRFRNDQSGSATIEAVLWFPVIFGVFILMVDATMLFHGQSQITRVVQDANRSLSVGRLDTEAEVEAMIADALSTLAPNAIAATTVDAGVVVTTVAVPATDLVALGGFGVLNGVTLAITSQHIIEY